MAQTAAAIQTELGPTPMDARVLRSLDEGGTNQQWYVIGNVDAPGRARWCTTTAADDAATQAASILTQLRA